MANTVLSDKHLTSNGIDKRRKGCRHSRKLPFCQILSAKLYHDASTSHEDPCSCSGIVSRVCIEKQADGWDFNRRFTELLTHLKRGSKFVLRTPDPWTHNTTFLILMFCVGGSDVA
jgi:hypothetical protein